MPLPVDADVTLIAEHLFALYLRLFIPFGRRVMRGYWLFHPFTGYLGETTQRSISAKWVSLILLTGVVAICGCGGDDGGTSSAPPAQPQLPPTQPAQAQESPETPPVVPESPATPQDVAESQPPVEPVAQQPPAARQTQAFAPAADPQAFAKPTTLPSQTAQTSKATAPAGASPFETSYLDPATELFVFVRPAAIASSSFLQALSGGKLGPADNVSESFGISIEEIESVTIGLSQLQKLAEQSAAQMTQQPSAADALQATMMPSVMPDPSGVAEHFVFVVRTTEAVKLEDLALPEGDGFIKTHSSKSYRQLADLGEQSPHMFAPDEKTFVIATDSVIQSIIDQGETPTQATADLSFVSADSHLIVAVVPHDREAFFANLPAIPTPEPQPEPAPTTAPEIKPGQDGYRVSEEDEDDEGKGKNKNRRKKDDEEDGRSLLGRGIQIADGTNSETEAGALAAVDKKEWQKLLETHAIGIALQIDLNEGLQLKITAQCDVPASPLRIQKELDVVVSQGKQAFEAVRSVLPGIIQEIAGSMVNSLTVTTDGTTVAISTTLPESQQANLTMLPMVVMGMMMSQAGNVEVMQQMVDWQERAEEVLNQGQLSVISEGLPEGLEVHGIARWSLPQPGQELSPPLLEVATVYAGGPGAFTRSFGRLKVTEANDASGVPLKWLGVSRNGRTEDPLHEMTAIDRTNGFTAHPPQGVATGLLFHPPGSDVQSLAVVAGEVVLEVPTSTREIMLHNVSSGPVSIDDPVLQGVHFFVTTETVDSRTIVRCTYSNQGPVGPITVHDASGNVVEASSSSQVIVGDQVQREWQLSEETKLPLGLVVAVQENVQEVSVPFRFENIPMPEPVSRFSGQEPLGSWTSANKDSDLPDGLTLEAQARWKGPQTPRMTFSEGTEQSTPTSVSQPPKLSLAGRSGGLGFGRGRDEDEEDRSPVNGGGGGLSRKEEKRQRKDKKTREMEVRDFEQV